MNNNDERDYAEEQYNGRLLREEAEAERQAERDASLPARLLDWNTRSDEEFEKDDEGYHGGPEGRDYDVIHHLEDEAVELAGEAAYAFKDGRAFMTERIREAAGRAIRDIEEAAKLPDEGTIDALNLLVNAMFGYMTGNATTLAEVADFYYSFDVDEPEEDEEPRTRLDHILGWINNSSYGGY